MKKQKLNNRIFDIIRPISHLVLLALSTLLTINLFVNFSENPFFKMVWIFFAVTSELIKIYLYMLAKKDFSSKSIITGLGKLTIYIGFAVISFIASVGFTLASIQGQSEVAVINNEVTDFTSDQIDKLWERYDSYQMDIDEAQSQIDGLGDEWITRRSELRDKVEEYRSKQDELLESINELMDQKKEESDAKQIVAISIFDLLGEEVGWSGMIVMKRLMLLLAFLLEVCTILTSGTINSITIIYKRMEEFLEHYLYKDEKGKLATRTITSVAQTLGWDVTECREYESALKETTFKNTPIISSDGKNNIVNWDKDSILKIMQWKFNS